MAVPTDIAGLQLWLKADALALSDGDPVSSWTRSDSSGNGGAPVQATGANQPVYKTNIANGLPAILFDGTSDFLKDTTLSIAQPTTTFVVAKNTDSVVGAGRQVFDARDNTVPRQVLYRQTTDAISMYAGTAEANSTALWGSTVFHRITAVYNGASSSARVDGVAASLSANPGSATLTGINIGSFESLSNFWMGYIAEIIMFSGALSGADQLSMEDYLLRWYATAPAFVTHRMPMGV